MTGMLPFPAVVGQEEAKLALILNALDPAIGGVLLRGEKGSAKSTLARGLAALLPGDAPFVELPVGATEDRVVGTIDLAAALTEGEQRFQPGLLAEADGGVLYVDEVNLLPDHLVDVLLDVAASGVNRVEREGISRSHASRFLLVGSMNPEEGDLRPQLLDRFGLAVDVRGPQDPAERAVAVRRRLDFDGDPNTLRAAYAAEERSLAERLSNSVPATAPGDLVVAISALCASVGAEGLRADLTICRAAAALAGWEGRAEATTEDVRRVAGLALSHRARRDPLDPAGIDRRQLDSALDDHLGGGDVTEADGGASGDQPDPGPSGGSPGPAGAPDGSWGDAGGAPEPPGIRLSDDRRSQGAAAGLGRGPRAEAQRGRVIRAREPDGPIGSVAVGATIRAAASRHSAEPGRTGSAQVIRRDVREAVREHSRSRLIVVAVDASGSMGAPERVASAKAAVMRLLTDAYQRRDLVALVGFRGDTAEVLLRPTSSVEVARARLADLPTGGRTPLAAGISASLDLARSRSSSHLPVLVIITDGRATEAPPGTDPVAASSAAAESVRRSGVEAVVVDVEAAGGGIKLGLARELATRMGARYVEVGDLDGASLQTVVQESLARS